MSKKTRHSIDDVPRRRHAGKSSQESLQHEREQIQAHSEALAVGGPHTSAVLPYVVYAAVVSQKPYQWAYTTHFPTPVQHPSPVEAQTEKPQTAPEPKAVTELKAVQEQRGTPIRPARVEHAGSFNIFHSQPVTETQMKRAKRAVVTSHAAYTITPPYATDAGAKFDAYAPEVKTTTLQGLHVNTGTCWCCRGDD